MTTRRGSQLYTTVMLACALLLAAGCQKKPAGSRKASGLDGAGASFPYPIYSRWAHDYEKEKGLELNYQSIGSGGGIAQIKAKVVDFGASDAPLEKAELEEAGLIQFPLVMGGVVPIVNLENVAAGELRLSAPVLVDIFLGEIKWWSDPAIQAINPDLGLPDKEITVVHRADGSGTTWIFTNYLARVSARWSKDVGTGKAVDWPAGVGGKGNEGVAQYVQKIDGSVGYVEYAYALENEIPFVELKNRSGEFVSPTIESFQAAAASADWENAPGFYMVLTDQPGEASWPITGASFILIHRDQQDAARARAMLEFFSWCFESGDAEAEELHYVPMPDNVVELIEQEWRTRLRAGGKPVWE